MADVGNLTAKLTLNTSGFDKAIGGVSGSVGKLASGITGALSGVTAAVGAAVTAAAAGIGAIVKESVQSFGEYEQLVSGAQKIFDQMDYSTIADDAANAWQTMNLSASQYLSMINQVGASFAATMGDEKGYEVAKQGMQAIADYASGTGRNVEELNTKFAMITRSASSYQSIADQFSGILPATSKDFLAQAQAAGLLSTKYTELTKVPIVEYQQAVSAMLEKGVADLNLTGNTAAETMDTITGSIAGLKAAWQNLMTGLADGSADIEMLIGNVVTMAEAVLTNIIPVIETVLQNLGQLITDLVPVIAERLPQLIETLIPMFLESAMYLVTTLVEALPGLVATLAEALISILPQLVEAVISLLDTLLTTIIPLILEVGIALILALGQGIADNVSYIMNSIIILLQFMVNMFLENLPMILDIGLQIILALVEGLLMNINTLTDMIVQLIGGIVQTIMENIPLLLEMGLKIGLALVEGILLAIPSLLVSIGRFLGIVDEAETHMVQKTTGMNMEMSNTALAVQNDALAIENYINSASMSVTTAAGSMQNTANTTTVGVYDSMGNLVSSFQTTATASNTTSSQIMSNANNTVLAIDQTNNQAITSMNQLRTGVSSASAEIISDVNANAIQIETSARTLIDKLWAMFEKFYKDVALAISDMMSQIKDLMIAIDEMNLNFTSSIDDMKYGLDKFVFGVSDSFNTVYHESVDLGDKLSDGILDIMDYLDDKVSSATDDIMSAFQDSADAISDAAQIAEEAAESADVAAGVASHAADDAATSAAKAWASVAEAESAAAAAASLASSFGGGRASGGPVTAGSTYLVGEQGPELFMPKSNGYIIDAEETADLFGGSRGDIVINIQGDVYDDERSMRNKMKAAIIDVLEEQVAYG